MKISYISWNYGKNRNGENLHLIRLNDGRGLLKTDAEMVKLGLANWSY